MDKAERVAESIAVWLLANSSQALLEKEEDKIAAIPRREYGDVRREAMEEAAQVAAADYPVIDERVQEAIIAAIRAAKEETCPPGE